MKIFDFIRYDIPYGLKNIVSFFPVIWKFRSWDYYFILFVFQFMLGKLKICLEDGNEVEEYRIPKIKNIERAIEILSNINNSNYIKMAEIEKGELSKSFSEFISINNYPEEDCRKDKEILDYCNKLENEEWNELWDIIKNDMRGWWD